MIDQQTLAFLIGAGFIFGLIGSAIGNNKGRPEAGFFLGFILGPVGWLLVAVGPDHRAKAAKDLAPLHGSAAGSNADRLLELKKLLDAGAITQTDYDAKKAVILQQI